MEGKELLEKQLTIADDVGTIQQQNKSALESVRALAGSEALQNIPEPNQDDVSDLVFRVNVEPEVLTAIWNKLNGSKPKDVFEKMLLDTNKRAMLFAAYYASVTPGTSRDAVLGVASECPVSENYEVYESRVTQLLGLDHGFFTVTGDTPAPKVNLAKDFPDDRIQSFRSRALNDNVPKSLVDRACEKADASIEHYSDFEKLMDKILDEDEKAEEAEKAKEVRYRRAIRNDLQRLWADKDILGTYSTAVYKTYNTTAVPAAELCEALRGRPELMLSVYREPIYSIVHQIDKPFVEEAVNQCLARWENNDVIEGIINGYLDQLGVPESERLANRKALIESLPESTKNQTAPDAWKAYTAVCLITQRDLGDSADITSTVFSDTDASIKFGARMESYIEDGVPIDAAQRQASEDFCHDMPEEEQISLFGKVGQFTGRAIRFKYEAAADMESLMRASLGEYADDYFAHKEEVKAHKAEIRKLKQEQKLERDKQKVLDKAERAVKLEKQKAEDRERREERKAEERERRKEDREYDRERRRDERQMGRGTYGNSRYQDSRYGMNTGYGTGMFGRNTGYGRNSYGYGGGGNFAPRMSSLVIAILAHLVVGLLSWLLFGGAKASFVAVGLIVATFGFIRKKMNEPNAIPMIIGGYAITIAVFFLVL